MLKFKSFNNFIVDTVVASLMSFSLIHALAASLNFKYNSLFLLLLVFLTVVLFQIIYLNKLTFRISYTLLGLSIIAGLIFAYNKNILVKIPGFIYSGLSWFSLYVNWEAPINKLYSYIIIALLIAVITLFIFYFSCKKFKFLIVLTAALAIFISQWTLNLFVSHNAFYIFLFVIPLYYLKHVYVSNSNSLSGDYVSPASFVVWSAPFCAIVVALALSFPANPKPIEWKWLDEKIIRLNNYLFHKYSVLTTGDYFSLNSSGFGENGTLGGKVRLDKTKVLKVEAPRQVYLKAIAKDYYTGSAWLNSVEAKNPLANPIGKNNVDLNEMLNRMNSIERANKEAFDKCFYTDKVKVTYLDIRTKSLFAPSKAYKIVLDSNMESAYSDSTGSLYIDKKLGSGFSYSFEVFSPKYSSKEFIELLKQSKKGYYFEKYYTDVQRWNDAYSMPIISQNPDGKSYTLNKEFITTLDNLYLSNLSATFENLNDIYTRYTQLPPSLPSRVGELAQSITASASTDYEKAKAIEEYLSTNFPYTLSPKATPKNSDFVDYFLFENKQGYCSYFATAMTILARNVGLPARYVEGYVLPPKPTSGSTYEVTNEQAHAWVEIYFEGYGWLPFEPTSPFRSAFYSNQEYQGNYDPSMNMDPYYLQYMSRLRGFSDSELDLSGEDSENAKAKNKILIYTLIVAGVLSLIVLIFLSVILYNHLRVKLMINKLKSLPAGESILSFYKYHLKLVSLNNLDIDAGETPTEFASRVDRYLILKPVKFKTITEIFIKVRYGNQSPSESEKNLVANFYDNIIDITKSHLGKFRFFFLRFLAGKI